MAEAMESANTEQSLEEYTEACSEDAVIKRRRTDLLPASIPTSVRGENINMGGNQTVVGGDNVEGNQTKIEKQFVLHMHVEGGAEKEDTEFNLESVRQQLMQQYKETKGKLPLLPGMPEAFATMEDLFVDLEIVEEDKKPSEILTKELRSCGKLVCIKRQKGDRNETEEVKRLLVRGKPGTGKSSTLSKLAYDWACNNKSPISKYKLLFAITINEIDTDTNLISIIQDQLLPEVSGKALRAYIQSNASSICLLLDGYDDAKKCFDTCKDVKNVLSSKWLADACVIVTSRPNEIGRFCQNYGPCTQVEIKGLSRFGRKEYVDKFFQISNNKEDMAPGEKVKNEGFLTHIERSQGIKELSFIPIILSMLCVLWVEDAKLPASITALYNEVVMHLAKHRFARNAIEELDIASIQTWVENVVSHVGKIALEGLLAGRVLFKASSFDKEQLKEAISLGILVKERKHSRLTVTNHVTFLYKTFQEFCAALYWGHLVDTDRKKFDEHLQQIREDNIFEMEYFLRFACGLSVKAVKIILPRVVQIMCQHNKLKDEDGEICGIEFNVCQQIPLFMLHEAESNDSNVKVSYILHSLLKPLFSTIWSKRGRSRPREFFSNDEFYQLFLSYLAPLKPNVGIVTQFHRPWLADVECVHSDHSPEAGKAILSGFAQIAKMIDQHNWGRLQNSLATCENRTCLATGNLDISPDSDTLQSGLRINNLDLEGNFIGESVEKLAQAYKYMPRLRHLILRGTSLKPSHCAALFDAFLAAGKMLLQQDKMRSDGQGHWASVSQGGLSIENLDLQFNDIGESIENLAQAYKYMPHLRRLGLGQTNLKPLHCATLFDAFIAAGKMQSQQAEMSSDAQGSESGATQGGLSIKYLDLNCNDIGESIENLAQAYKYMPHLRYLDLGSTSLNPSHCAALFDGLIAAGKMLSPQDEMSSDTNGNGSGASQTGLSIEHLDLQSNTIGEPVDKLLQALQFMPHLTLIDVLGCGLDTKSLQCLHEVLININGKFKKRSSGWWQVY